MDFKALLVLACVAAGSLAGPVRETQCSEECNSREDEGMFRSYKSYYFSYAVDIDSRISGTNNDQSSTVHIEAKAVIEGLSACEKLLELRDISISERQSDGSMAPADMENSFAESLSAHPLRFSMESNGTITSVCPEAGEEIWALNVKRGFLSHIQTKRTTSNDVLSVSGVFETGVTGTCMPVYIPTGEMSFTKRNDYLMCKHRTNLNMFVDAVPVHLLAPTASPLKSSMECDYRMDSQSISSVDCHEIHTLKPFTESQSQPEVRVHSVISKLEVVPYISSSLSNAFARRTSLLYEDPVQASEVFSDDVRSTIEQICESITNGISSETPGLFETLTKQFGELDTDNMNTVINRLFRICPGVGAKSVIDMVKDALTDCDTEQCAQGFHSIIRSEDSSENEFYLRKWFMKLVFHKNPTKNMINLVKNHVSGSEEVNLPAYYALSSMIHQYCSISDDDCSKDTEITGAAEVFENNLHDACQPENEDDEKKILMSLRAIGNMGIIMSKNLLINRCQRNQNSNQLRVAAIQAFRRASCENVPVHNFLEIFGAIDNDSELRIAAYRAIIRCPSLELLQNIAHIMASEQTNQVACYVSSHLANLRNSQDPMVYDLQTALSQSSLANVTKCGMDYRKFSHNYGLSYFDDESGNGIHFDGDVVFSPKSYLPRSARLAMNVDLFGYGIDLFELDARAEGWQEVLESFMTPSNEDREANMIEKVQRMLKKRVSRQRREGIKNTALNKIRKEYESSHDQEQEVIEQVFIAMKALGNDVFYKDRDDFQHMAEKFSRESIMNIITSLTTYRTHEYSLNKNFKTSKAAIPTMAGMPLEVNIQGAFNSILKASGKLDVLSMMFSPRQMAIQGSFEPSAAIEINSNMMVDAHFARSGLSHRVNMASSLSLGGSLSFENGLLKAKVIAPPRRETIIDASSSLFFMQRNEMVPVSEPEGDAISIDETFSNSRYSVHISGSRPNMPFCLPGALFHTWGMEITLDKLEESLVSYDLEVGFRTEKSIRNGEAVKVDHLRFLVGATGSETLGVYSLDVAYHRYNTTLLINANTPNHGSTYFIGSLRNETNSKRLHLQATRADETYILEAGMDTIPLSNGVKFVPVFALTIPNIVSYDLVGYVSSVEDEKVLDLRLVDGFEQNLVSLRGELIRNASLHLLSTSGNIGAFSGSFQSGYKTENTTTSVMITPIFSLTSAFPVIAMRMGGGPLVISDSSVTMSELFLATKNTRLFEMSNLHLGRTQMSFGVQGMIKETIPFGIEFEMTNVEQKQYSVDLNLDSLLGAYNIRGTLFNKSADSIYRLEVITEALGNEYFNITSEFKNEVNVHQYLDTIIKFRGNQIYRTKNGLQTQPLNAKTRFTPIFILETNQLGSLTLEGSLDVSESGILISDLRLIGAEDIVTLSGSASVNHDTRAVSWSFNVGGAYISEDVSGSASNHENTLIFQTSMTSDGSNQPDYSLTIDLQNSTNEGEIISWNGKVELNMPHHPELSFRMDTDYTLTPGHSTGNVFRLCYDGIDCTFTDKRITLSHDLTFSHVRNEAYSDEMEVSYTHPAADVDLSMKWNTNCTSDVSSGMELTLKDHEEDLFTTTIRYIPEGSATNGSTTILLMAPGYFDYEFTDTFHFSNPMDILWLSKYRSGEQIMSFLVRFNMTSESEGNFWTSTVLEYTDIRNNAYTLEYILAQNNDSTHHSKLDSVIIKKNSELKMLMLEEDMFEMSETRFISRYNRAIKTTIEPIQDISYNQTVTVDLQRGNTNMDMQLRFLPGQKPISLIADFTNRSTETKKEGQVIATLSLPKTSITVFTEGRLEKGVPSGNLSIKIQPLMRATQTYVIEFAMKNRSSSQRQIYDTALTARSPANINYGLKHTIEYSKDHFLPMASSLTGTWGEEEVVANALITFNETQNRRIECDLSLAIPEHMYSLRSRFDMDSRNITITKDSNILWSSNYSQNFQESDAGFTYSLQIRESVMTSGSETIVTVSNISNAYAVSLQMQENDRENLYANWALDLFPGQQRFDLTTETRSDFLPGYNTRTSLNFMKTELSSELSYSINIHNKDVFSMTFTNSSSEEPNSRVTTIVFKQPTNPDLELRQIVLIDSCSMDDQSIAHNTSVMWGSLLPTQTIAFHFKRRRNLDGAKTMLMLHNVGRVLGFGRKYTLDSAVTKAGSRITCFLAFSGENDPIISLHSEFTNNSQEYMKNYNLTTNMHILDKHFSMTIGDSPSDELSSRVMWGSLLINEAIGFSFNRTENQGGARTLLRLLDEGNVLGFGREYILNSSANRTESGIICMLAFSDENGTIISMQSDLTNNSLEYMKNNNLTINMRILDKHAIGFSFNRARNQDEARTVLRLLNEGRVFDFGREYTLNSLAKKTESGIMCMLALSGENGNIIAVHSDLTNNTQEYMKSYTSNITLIILNRHPITVKSNLVHNSSRKVLDADLTITYNTEKDQVLTAGIDVTRELNGHSVTLNLQHLVNTIDVTIMGAYSNSSEVFEVSLENSVLLGDELHEPQLSFHLNRNTKEVELGYTGSRHYGFRGQFLNLTGQEGLVYEINCVNNYNGREVPYRMIFNERQRRVGMIVQYNPENPDDIWELLAGYQNETAIFASLDTVHSRQTIHNASLVFNLDNNKPRVLTTQIKWEPAWPQDLKAAVQNILNKTMELQAQQHASMCRSWRSLASRLNQTAMNFMLSNMEISNTVYMQINKLKNIHWNLTLASRLNQTAMNFRQSNKEISNMIYAQINKLKRQVYTRWILTQPRRMVQLANLAGKWIQFNKTLHDNLIGYNERSMAYMALAQQFEDMKEYFSTGFAQFSMEVVINWMTFEEAFRVIQDEFDETAIAEHLAASQEARDAFFNDLLNQFELDIASMDPNWTPLQLRLETISQNFNAVGERIREEFSRRIAVLNSEKKAIDETIAAIVEDIISFNTTLRNAARSWKMAIYRELVPFLNLDVSQFSTLVSEFNETIHAMLDKGAALQLYRITAGTFMAPYVQLLSRTRRQAPAVSHGNLNFEAFETAMNKFNAQYGNYQVPQVAVPSTPVATVVHEDVGYNFTAVINILKKVFNGTYELTKLDLMNGEILFKIFLKDFSNFTSLSNVTHQFINLRVLERFNVTKLKKVIGMLQDGTLSDFKTRFMEQFTANRTYYEEMMQEIQARMRERGVQNAMETRIIPYLERMGDRIVEGGRPFFGRIMDIPDEEERRSFLEELTNEMNMASLERLYGRMKQTMCGVHNTMIAAAMKAKFATCPRSWMPPYGANALVIGAQHYMTFDKLFYDFSGKCGYLLARDFAHENDFSAIVNYERDMEIPIRNMMFMINSTTFEIKSDGTVRVDRRDRELPLQVGGTAVIRIGDSIFLKNAEGVSVVCKLRHDVCALKLSGRYFDSTAGLLGNFNFESYDDLKTPGNELQTNVTAFTESWKVGKNCIQSEAASLDRNRVIPTIDSVVNFDPLYPDNQACARMFLDNCSPLASCHSGVDPDSFYRMCILDTRSLPEDERKSKMCSIAVAYKTQCWYSRQPVPMPHECVTCELGEQSFEAGKSVRIEGDAVPNQVDIVFVVEEKLRAQQYARYLDNIVYKLADELEIAGYEDTWFGLAAFGGSGVHDAAHQHTINHKIFNNDTSDFRLGRDSLEFADGGNNDTFAAIKLAADYPFRTGAAKHIILLSCSEHREENSELSFKDLSVMLRKQAISLTILMDYQFRINKKSSVSNSKSKSKTELVYGIDSTAAYTSKMAGLKPFKGSATLRQYTNEPKGVNALLAQESGGAIFDSSMLRDKGFNDVFVNRLVRKTEPAECQVCNCVPDDLVGVGRSICEKCTNPLNVFGEEIRGGVRDFELRYGLPHWRYPDQIVEQEEVEE